MEITHRTILRSDSIFYGWPANNGAWQWGDEFLFGVMMARRDGAAVGLHKISGITTPVLIRSSDGGRTWEPEFLKYPLFRGDGDLEPWPANMSDRIIRVSGVYDQGGENHLVEGTFCSSADRGKSWTGPHELIGLDLTFGGLHTCTARTSRLDDLVFLSHAKERFQDRVLVARLYEDKFIPVSSLIADMGRLVMPVAVRKGSKIYVACRRRFRERCWIELYVSANDGQTWMITNHKPLETGGHNGNPPAIAVVGDRLVVAYGNRDIGSMYMAISDGHSPWETFAFRTGGSIDFGYPQLFTRSDGSLVCVYYWYGGIESSTIRFDD